MHELKTKSSSVLYPPEEEVVEDFAVFITWAMRRLVTILFTGGRVRIWRLISTTSSSTVNA
jgi:hypothetical protein